MTRGILGATIGLIVGWVVAAALQRAADWISVHSLLVILTVIVGAVLGANIAGFMGGLIGGVVGGFLGVLAIQVLSMFLKIAAMILGATLGWRWATAGG